MLKAKAVKQNDHVRRRVRVTNAKPLAALRFTVFTTTPLWLRVRGRVSRPSFIRASRTP
jgi:hypothetical protein